MPQLWLTYDEIAEELGCTAADARDTVVRRAWTRKRSSDGLTRVLMPRDLMQDYFRAHAVEPRASAPPPGLAAAASAAELLRRVLSRPPASRAS